MILALDIETIPNPEVFDKLPEPTVALGRTKDPIKVAAKVEEARQKQISKLALNPMYARVCCVCLCSVDKDVTYVLKNMTDEAEVALLFKVFVVLAGSTTKLATWNGIGFDLPFIYKRAMLLKMTLPQALPSLPHWTRRYSRDNHIDLMQEWGAWRDFAKLNDVAMALLGDEKDDIDFAEFPELMKTEEGRAKIGTYCLKDTRLTYRVYEFCRGYLF